MIVNILLILAAIFMTIGFVGLFRAKDFLSKLIVSALIDTIVGLIVMMALMIHMGFNIYTGKMMVIFILFLITNPITIHTIARAYFISVERKDEDG